jgi:uncharacterized protein (DUF427 family)
MTADAAKASKTVKIPGPDHPITIERNPSRVVVKVAGKIVADTRRALTLREASYPGVTYIPREDADMALLARTDHSTYCPYKGDRARWRALDQRDLDLRSALRRRRTDQESSGVLSRPRGFDRRTA